MFYVLASSKPYGRRDEMRMGEGIKTFGARKMIFDVKSVSSGVQIEFFERVVVPTVTHGMDTWDIRMDKRHMLDVREVKYLQSVYVESAYVG